MSEVEAASTAEQSRCWPSVSVIIPAFNEAAHLRECLNSLCVQDYPGEFEVILVDNASTDDTRSVCAAFPGVKYIYFDRCKSSYGARNEGVRQSFGDVLAFFDADQTAHRTYLRTLLDNYVAGDHRQVFEGLLDDDPRVPDVIRRYHLTPHMREDTERTSVPSTSCSAVPREFFDELGGFKEHLLSGGDVEFFERALRVAKVHRVTKFIGYHYHTQSVRDLLARKERYGFGDCLRLRAADRPLPTLRHRLWDLVRLGARTMRAALAVPFRHPRGMWVEVWYAQFLRLYGRFCHFRGFLKFRLGCTRAGDLPADASTRRLRTGVPNDGRSVRNLTTVHSSDAESRM